jgi:putative flippase GtrA
VELIQHKLFRFLLSGVVNTALTWGIYLVLLLFFSYLFSYTASYLLGILISYFLNRFFVFQGHQGLRSVLALPLIYAIQYGLSMVMLWCWVEIFELDSRVAPLVAVIVTVPVTYALTKNVFSSRSDGTNDGAKK